MDRVRVLLRKSNALLPKTDRELISQAAGPWSRTLFACGFHSRTFLIYLTNSTQTEFNVDEEGSWVT